MIDLSKLTLGEVAKIEELSGQSIGAIGDETAPKGLALAALAFIAKRREDPTYKWNAAQELTLDDANEILGLNETKEETPAPLDEAPARSSRAKKTPEKS